MTVYVYYPRGRQTGGPEALHQLVAALNELNIPARLVPTPTTATTPRAAVYETYRCAEASAITDHPDNLVIVPEADIHLLKTVRRARTAVWWLSVDNSPLFALERRLARRTDGYLKRQLLRVRDMRDAIRDRVATGVSRREQWQITRRSVNFAQSHYAEAFLYLRMGVVATMLSDYTTPAGGSSSTARLPRSVAFNPIKGTAVTARLRRLRPDLTWIPLEDMTPSEVRETLAKADIYLDLGHHPGKDRLPREAASNGAVVIIAGEGAGAFSCDTPIPRAYKVPTRGSADQIAERASSAVDRVLSDRDAAYAAQQPYTSWIHGERDRFLRQVADAFHADLEN